MAEDTGTIDFPKTSTTYYTNFYFMHWACNSSGSVCSWDPDGGTASYAESISELCTGVCDDKWNTVPGEFATLGTKSYGYQSWPPPGGGSPATIDQEALSLVAETSLAPASASSLEAFTLASMGSGEAHIYPDLSAGLAAYSRRAQALAARVVQGGPSRAVITFARPVTRSELAALAATGVHITDVEAVSSPARDGTRWTAGDAYGMDIESAMREIESEFGVKFLGYVAAEAVIPAPGILEQVQSMDYVWLVDLSLEQAGRAHRDLVKIGQNDLYWWLAGW